MELTYPNHDYAYSYTSEWHRFFPDYETFHAFLDEEVQVDQNPEYLLPIQPPPAPIEIEVIPMSVVIPPPMNLLVDLPPWYNQGRDENQVDDFPPKVMYDICCGRTLPNFEGRRGLTPPMSEVNFSRMQSRVVVRRKMGHLNHLFHSIRTNTSSLVAVGYFGTYKDVLAVSNCQLRPFFDDESFLAERNNLETNEILVLIKLRGICAETTFILTPQEAPVPRIYEHIQFFNGIPVRLFGVVFEFALTTCATSVTDVNHLHNLVVEVESLAKDRESFQMAKTEFEILLDVLPSDPAPPSQSVEDGPGQEFCDYCSDSMVYDSATPTDLTSCSACESSKSYPEDF